MSEGFRFYIGLDRPHDAQYFGLACLSVNALRKRKKPVVVGGGRGFAMIDSGAFTEISRHGGYRHDVADYARSALRHLSNLVPIEIAVAQDYMCEPFIVVGTRPFRGEHQRPTIERHDGRAGGASDATSPFSKGSSRSSTFDTWKHTAIG